MLNSSSLNNSRRGSNESPGAKFYSTEDGLIKLGGWSDVVSPRSSSLRSSPLRQSSPGGSSEEIGEPRALRSSQKSVLSSSSERPLGERPLSQRVLVKSASQNSVVLKALDWVKKVKEFERNLTLSEFLNLSKTEEDLSKIKYISFSSFATERLKQDEETIKTFHAQLSKLEGLVALDLLSLEMGNHVRITLPDSVRVVFTHKKYSHKFSFPRGCQVFYPEDERSHVDAAALLGGDESLHEALKFTAHLFREIEIRRNSKDNFRVTRDNQEKVQDFFDLCKKLKLLDASGFEFDPGVTLNVPGCVTTLGYAPKTEESFVYTPRSCGAQEVNPQEKVDELDVANARSQEATKRLLNGYKKPISLESFLQSHLDDDSLSNSEDWETKKFLKIDAAGLHLGSKNVRAFEGALERMPELLFLDITGVRIKKGVRLKIPSGVRVLYVDQSQQHRIVLFGDCVCIDPTRYALDLLLSDLFNDREDSYVVALKSGAHAIRALTLVSEADVPLSSLQKSILEHFLSRMTSLEVLNASDLKFEEGVVLKVPDSLQYLSSLRGTRGNFKINSSTCKVEEIGPKVVPDLPLNTISLSNFLRANSFTFKEEVRLLIKSMEGETLNRENIDLFQQKINSMVGVQDLILLDLRIGSNVELEIPKSVSRVFCARLARFTLVLPKTTQLFKS